MFKRVGKYLVPAIHVIASVITVAGFGWGVWTYFSTTIHLSMLNDIYLPLKIVVYILVEASFTIVFTYPIFRLAEKVISDKINRSYWLVAFICLLVVSAWQTATFIGLFFNPSDPSEWFIKSILPLLFSSAIFIVQCEAVSDSDQESERTSAEERGKVDFNYVKKTDNSYLAQLLLMGYAAMLFLMCIVVANTWVPLDAPAAS